MSTSTSVTTTTTESTSTTTNPVGSVASINYGAKLTISSATIAVGQQVTVTGTGCPARYWGAASLDYDNNAPLIFDSGGTEDDENFTSANGDESGGTADADGLWMFVATVPMVAPGTLTLNGFCTSNQSDDNDLTSDFRYPPVSVTVTTPYQLEVRPATTVTPGTTLTVNLVGGPCTNDGAGGEVILYSESGTQIAFPHVSAATAGGSAQILVVPPGLTPGQYQVEADCSEYIAVFGSYAPVTITVQ